MNRADRRRYESSEGELLGILRTLDVDRALARFTRQGLPFPPGPLSPREMAEVGLHKIRSIHALMTPAEQRLSRAWLDARGYAYGTPATTGSGPGSRPPSLQ